MAPIPRSAEYMVSGEAALSTDGRSDDLRLRSRTTCRMFASRVTNLNSIPSSVDSASINWGRFSGA
ncbi:hypothetical protein DPMN_117619 [Dreissena polymorpha]|uniref:Uncharacterized protein n=1 Tax=Dreissena polymorpha TaxID=45954 RepID=A0A9D4JKX0_DREPO|nr:hypothetical protein DPMN_117619 [Dreissena polymorpha]